MLLDRHPCVRFLPPRDRPYIAAFVEEIRRTRTVPGIIVVWHGAVLDGWARALAAEEAGVDAERYHVRYDGDTEGAIDLWLRMNAEGRGLQPEDVPHVREAILAADRDEIAELFRLAS